MALIRWGGVKWDGMDEVGWNGVDKLGWCEVGWDG